MYLTLKKLIEYANVLNDCSRPQEVVQSAVNHAL
jgi:hypothetical protein